MCSNFEKYAYSPFNTYKNRLLPEKIKPNTCVVCHYNCFGIRRINNLLFTWSVSCKMVLSSDIFCLIIKWTFVNIFYLLINLLIQLITLMTFNVIDTWILTAWGSWTLIKISFMFLNCSTLQSLQTSFIFLIFSLIKLQFSSTH